MIILLFKTVYLKLFLKLCISINFHPICFLQVEVANVKKNIVSPLLPEQRLYRICVKSRVLCFAQLVV